MIPPIGKNPFSVEDTSNKIMSLNKPLQTLPNRIMLPNEKYQPFFLKVLSDFMKFHNVPLHLPVPQGSMKLHVALSCILDIMVHSMGEENRNLILTELEEYRKGLPPSFR